MGTICAPVYANMFRGKFEKTIIHNHLSIHKFILNFYCRFIDDIFFLWNGTVIQLHNSLRNSITAILQLNSISNILIIELLEATVYKSKVQNKLLTTVYCKPTDRRNFLHYTSAHPRSFLTSITFSQALRLKKICAETSELSKNLQLLKK